MYIKNSIYFALLVHRQEYRNEPPSDTLLRYLNMFHLVPSPTSLQFTYNGEHILGLAGVNTKKKYIYNTGNVFLYLISPVEQF
jgi:hypothetical protein